jgi:cell division septation protein DedD
MPKPQPTATVAAQPSPAPASVATGGSYIIQVASVQKIDGAQDLIGRLSKNGYPAFVEKTDLGSKGVWYRVYVGPFASKSAADGAASTLRVSPLASSPIVRKR